MKKSLLVLALAVGTTAAFAQDLTSKKGEKYLPEANDWSVGIEATPFLNYVGSFLSNAGATAPTWNHLNGQQTIIGKMFKDEKTAYRAIVRIGINKSKNTADIAKPAASTATATSYPNVNETVEDVVKQSSSFVGLGAGMEMRRGTTRLQGYYGADAMISFSSSKDKFTYGNDLTQGTSDPNIDPVGNSTNWAGTVGYANTSAGIANYNGVTGARIMEMKSGATVGITVRGFIGAEYFIFPKISIAGEFGWGIGYGMTGASKTTYEAEGVATGATAESKADITVEGKKSSSFSIDTDVNKLGTGASGALRLNLHF